MFQQVIIIGNVGRDAELSYTPQGIAVAKFSVAVEKVTGKGEQKQSKTTWFRVTIWRERAENLSQYIKKGNKIMCKGEIDVSAYTGRDGLPSASLELTADEIKFLGGGNSDNRQSGSQNRQSESLPEHEDNQFVGDIPF